MPPKAENPGLPCSRTVGTKLADVDVQRLAELAGRRGVTLSATVREMVRDGLDREATGPPERRQVA